MRGRLSRGGLVAVTLLGAPLAVGCGGGGVQPVGLPPPEQGFQLALGPFEVPAGTEVQLCTYRVVELGEEVDVTRFQVAYEQGSHHFNVFRTDLSPEEVVALPELSQERLDAEQPGMTPPGVDALDGYARPCFKNAVDFAAWQLLVGSQKGALDWQLPAGVGFHLKARQVLLLQSHYANTSSQPSPSGFGRVFANFTVASPGEVAEHVGTVFANNRAIELPPHADVSFDATCTLDAAVPVTVIGVTGHFHSRGREFRVANFDGTQPLGGPYYQSDAWDEPRFETFEPDEVIVPAGGGFLYTCSFSNPTEETIRFGGHVETEEHCNLFAYYYPSVGATTYCF